MPESVVDHALGGLFRESCGRIVAALAKEFRDLELAQDALQESLEVATRKWPVDGLPRNAAGWLYVTARHKAIDALRRETRQKNQARKQAMQMAREVSQPAGLGFTTMYGINGPPDERLSLIFACCHPVINHPAQVALTLHTLCGLKTPEIAAAFLIKEITIAQRIVRAKRKIKAAGVPFAIPDIEASPERLSSVLAVIYLVFNAGYTAHAGEDLFKTDLCDEAIFLARMLVQLLPGQSEAQGLLALLLIQDSRRAARAHADGSLILLSEQDRSLWDQIKIAEAITLLKTARELSPGGIYQTQAEIAAVHAGSKTAEQTNWEKILKHYDRLLMFNPSPVVQLNRTVAIKMAKGPEEALLSLNQHDLANELQGYRYYHSTRGEFLLELNRQAEAHLAFQQALGLTENEQERAHLEGRLKKCLS